MGSSSKDIATSAQDFIKDLKNSLVGVNALLARLSESTGSVLKICLNCPVVEDAAAAIQQTLEKKPKGQSLRWGI